MPSASPVTLEVKLPVPVPLVVLLLLIVGLGDVLQHTPRAVTSKLPSAVTLPPHTAVFAVIEVTSAVVIEGNVPSMVVKFFSSSSTVSTELYATYL